MILVPQKQFPITYLQLYFSHPPQADPDGKSVALHTLAQRQLLRGTHRLSRANFIGEVGMLGTEISLIQRRFAHSISGVVLSRKWESLMELIIEALTEPSLCPDELAQSKRAYQAELAARYDMDAALAWLWLSRRIFKRHSWLWAGVSVTHDDIEQVTHDEVRETWSKIFDSRYLLPCLTTDLSVEQVTPTLLHLSNMLRSELSKQRDGVSLQKTQDTPLLCPISPLEPLPRQPSL